MPTILGKECLARVLPVGIWVVIDGEEPACEILNGKITQVKQSFNGYCHLMIPAWDNLEQLPHELLLDMSSPLRRRSLTTTWSQRLKSSTSLSLLNCMDSKVWRSFYAHDSLTLYAPTHMDLSASQASLHCPSWQVAGESPPARLTGLPKAPGDPYETARCQHRRHPTGSDPAG